MSLPRWLTALKLNTLAQGAKIVRHELTGRAAGAWRAGYMPRGSSRAMLGMRFSLATACREG